MSNKKPDVVVIGSGVAGLATSIRLSVAGHKVTVLEKHNGPGGKLTAFRSNGFHFDKGPSLFTQPENIEALFELAGENISDYFSYSTTDVHCNYFFPDGKKLKAYADLKLFEDELVTQLGEKRGTLKKYLHRAEVVYENIAKIFLNYSLHKRSTWVHSRILRALKSLKPALLLKSMHSYHAGCFTSPETVQLFDRYATYNGSNPYTAPAMLSVIPHLEYNSGAYFAKGGMISITNALYNLCLKLGVQFHFDTTAENIVVENKRTTGVKTNKDFFASDIVISNIDVYYTYKNLLNNIKKAKSLLNQERSSSALIFYWGINKQFSELGLHNIFFSENYKAEFASLFKTTDFYPDPTVYINITSKQEDSHAPIGMENWFVMINVPATNKEMPDTDILKVKQHILDKLSNLLGTNISDLIVSENILTPHDIDLSTGSYMGSLYGTSSNSAMAAFFRHPNFSKEIKGLYFCGGSVHPGGGIPLCLQSASIVASLIAHDYE